MCLLFRMFSPSLSQTSHTEYLLSTESRPVYGGVSQEERKLSSLLIVMIKNIMDIS